MHSLDAAALTTAHPWTAELVGHLDADAAMLRRCGREGFAFRPLLVHGCRADVRHRAFFGDLAAAVDLGLAVFTPGDAADQDWRASPKRREIRIFEDVERWPREALTAIEAVLRSGWPEDVLPVVSVNEVEIRGGVGAAIGQAA